MPRNQNSTLGNSSPTSNSSSTSSSKKASSNIFGTPIDTSAPIPAIPTTDSHPVPRLGIQQQGVPLHTNKFYANLFLGSQAAGVWTHPYQISWAKGGGPNGSWGMAISHIDASQRVMGPDPTTNPATYFINPNGLQSMIISAAELSNSTTLTTDNLTSFSTNVNLSPTNGSDPAISFPLVQGMGFVTGVFNGATPLIQTSIGFSNMTRAQSNPKVGITKYTFITNDQKKWLLYAYSPFSGAPLNLTLSEIGAKAASGFTGVIQIAKDPGNAEAMYDAGCGTYPTDAGVYGTVDGPVGTYTFAWSKAGLPSCPLIMFALPHHVQSFSIQTNKSVTTTQMMTTTKGMATAVVADTWELIEPNMPVELGFKPWTPTNGTIHELTDTAISDILPVARTEIAQNMTAQTDLNSMYYSGKGLAKFAVIVLTLNDLLNDQETAQTGLTSLKQAFDLFISNKQQFPLTYETAWRGIVSTASYNGDSGADFGNTYYNDHHFHYGYFILAGAIIAHLDPSWLTDNNGANKDYINGLARDIANPNTYEDTYFPFYRMFDWYHGHSWAHGLYETYDGKDQESSSEDSMSAYALKMWGQVIGDADMEARGNLQLAITARSLQSYFLYDTDNTIEPSNFIGNRVSGILFENKIDHITYFGGNIEYIQGIHMMPLLPHSTLTRTKSFVKEEWSTFFDNGRADSVQGGWKGILYANLAMVDPVTSYNFFNQPDFDDSLLDGGASRTWYMAWAAALGGA